LLFSAFTSSKTILHRAGKPGDAQAQIPEWSAQALEAAGEFCLRHATVYFQIIGL
jgi:hypothetical protein